MVIDKRRMSINFGRASNNYESNSVLQKTVAIRLLERLKLFHIKPQTIVDIGSGVGFAARQLSKIYGDSKRIIQFDLSYDMLYKASALERRFFSKQYFICGDIEELPIVDGAVDLFFSNLMLQWCNDLDAAFNRIRAALATRGLFLFATLGPDTLKELRSSWGEADQDLHVNDFIDMHDIGDALVRAGFVDSVMDAEHIVMTYEDCHSLIKDLKALGAGNSDTRRAKGLTGKGKFKKMISAYEKFREHGRLPATYEIIYGHAWAPLQESSRSTREVFFPVSSLKLKR